MFEVLQELIMVGLYFFEGYCIQYFFCAFVKPKLSKLSCSKYTVSLVWIAVCFLTRALFPQNNSAILILKLFFYIAVLFLFSLFWYRGSVLKKLSVVIHFAAINELVFFTAYSFLYISSWLVGAAAMQPGIMKLPLSQYTAVLNGIVIVTMLMMMAMRGALLYFSCKKIVSGYRFREEQRPDREIFFYLLPAAAGIMVSILVRLLLLDMKDGNPVLLYNQYPSLYFIIPLLALVLLWAILKSFRLYQDMIGLQKEQSEKIVLENQVAQMQNSMTEMEHFYRGIRSVKHDMRNQVAVLEQMLVRQEQVKSDLISQYFEDMQRTLTQLERTIHTGNAVSDAVVESKFQSAAARIENIRLQAEDFALTKQVRIRPYDIGIILNNGLDNAIEACEALRGTRPEAETYITIRSYWKRNMYFIEIENSFEGVLKMDEAQGYPQTTKADKSLHGIGLRNIRNCAKKYDGDMDCIYGDGRFILSVMLKNQELNYREEYEGN